MGEVKKGDLKQVSVTLTNTYWLDHCGVLRISLDKYFNKCQSLDTQTLVFRLHQKNNRGGLELEVQPCVLRWSCDGTPLKNVRWVYIRCLGRSNSRRAVCHQSVLYVNISTIKHSLAVKSQVESWLSLQSRTSNCRAVPLTAPASKAVVTLMTVNQPIPRFGEDDAN